MYPFSCPLPLRLLLELTLLGNIYSLQLLRSILLTVCVCEILNDRSEGTVFLRYKIPTRGLLGLRNAILTASRGTAILNTVFDSYGPWAGDISTRDLGSLVSLGRVED